MVRTEISPALSAFFGCKFWFEDIKLNVAAGSNKLRMYAIAPHVIVYEPIL